MIQEANNDIKRITDWMKAHHCGFANRAKRGQIALALFLEDRYFRDLCSQIPEIITSSAEGYYFLPTEDPTGTEEAKALELIDENRRRAIALFLRSKRQKRAVREMATRRIQMSMF
jgi:hypothetical protein